mmetsp:Transcript_16033/g.44339  ORF Transcript_16033/g.44339 Transcript_16033/m.44339 type:complete len:267 (+) Transcript_16033:344-1144(+)
MVEAAHPSSLQAARDNAPKVGQARFLDVDGQPVLGDPPSALDADGRHLVVVDPDPRDAVLSLGDEDRGFFAAAAAASTATSAAAAAAAAPGDGQNDGFFQSPHVPVNVLLVAPQVQYGVHGDLSRSVVRHLAAPVHTDHRDGTRRCRDELFVRSGSQRVDRMVLEHDDCVFPAADGSVWIVFVVRPKRRRVCIAGYQPFDVPVQELFLVVPGGLKVNQRGFRIAVAVAAAVSRGGVVEKGHSPFRRGRFHIQDLEESELLLRDHPP